MSAAPLNWSAVRATLVSDALRGTRLRVRAKVCGESMLPSLWPSDEVEIEGCSLKDVRPGEIVLVQRDERLVLHRLVSADNLGCLLQGDSVSLSDPPYPAAALLGRLVRRIDGGRRSLALGLRPGFGAKLFRALGVFLCHCGSARRLAMKLHCRQRASGTEFRTLDIPNVKLGQMRVPQC
jgi:hypothetical protein